MKEISLQPKLLSKINAQQPAGSSKKAVESCAFKDFLKKSIADVDRLHKAANQSIEALSTGRSRDIHQTMIAMEKADTSFQLLMQVRNKLLSAYEQISRMHI